MEIEKYKKSNQLAEIQKQVSGKLSLFEAVRLANIQLAENNRELLVEMLIELNQFTNVSRKMNKEQIAETVNMLFEGYPRVSLQEYAIFFNRIKSGQFGQLYESLDGIKIMAFMKDFYSDILNCYNEFKEEKHLELKRQWGCRDLDNYSKY